MYGLKGMTFGKHKKQNISVSVGDLLVYKDIILILILEMRETVVYYRICFTEDSYTKNDHSYIFPEWFDLHKNEIKVY